MLREYQLTNFKAFGETVTIPIRPLTLIFGANSSGKSSIFQSLLLLKQTLEANNPQTVLLPKGSLVNLRAYADFVHRHETERDFEFRARFDLKTPLVLSRDETIREAGLGVRFTHSRENHPALLSAGSLALKVGDKEQSIIQYGAAYQIQFASKSEFWERWWNALHSCHTDRDPEYRDLVFLLSRNSESRYDSRRGPAAWTEQAQFDTEVKHSEMKEALCMEFEKALSSCSTARRDDPFLRPQNFLLAHPPGAINFHSPNSYMMDTWMALPFNRVLSSFHTNLENLVYLGPLRSYPERYYTFSGETTEYVGQRGEHLPSILFENPDLLEKINADLKGLGVQYTLKVSKLQHGEDASPSNVFSLRLIDKNIDVDVSLRDVGFGISQVLPIVAQAELCEKKTLLIEQPEIHLHPAHQAELGDLFIRSAKKRGNTFLLETHSEHLLLRIMRRMRETSEGKLPEGAIAVRPEDVAVLFVESDGSQSIVREMPLNEHGELVKAWPGGFFEEGLREIF